MGIILFTHENFTKQIWEEFVKHNNVTSCVLNKIDYFYEDIGFVANLDRNIMSYFPFGIVYKITDINTGNFYIGKCEREKNWEQGYPGSGTKWYPYYKKYQNAHEFKREILKDNFFTPKELHEAEVEEINKEIENKQYMNILATIQYDLKPCKECGGLAGYKPSCSKKKELCEECHTYGHHKVGCSKYKKRPPIKCSVCNGTARHRSWCVNFNGSSGMKPSDVKYVCITCKGINGAHEKNCINRKISKTCKECGGLNGQHKKGCSKYKKKKVCSECGSNPHKNTCSKYTKPINSCEFCGTPLEECIRKNCPNFKNTKFCQECGKGGGFHSKDCSRYKPRKPCSECGSIGTNHKKICSQYKEQQKCLECNSIDGKHKKTCSKYIVPKNSCSFCGTPPGGRHKKDCPNFKPIICNECGGRSGRHKDSCSKYNPPKRCKYCGSATRHKDDCPSNINKD